VKPGDKDRSHVFNDEIIDGAIQEVDVNRTIVVDNFNPDSKVGEMIEAPTREDALNSLAIKVPVDYEDDEGRKITGDSFEVGEVSDVEPEKLINKCPGLAELIVKRDIYDDFTRQLSENDIWKKLFEDPAYKQGVLELWKSWLKYIDENQPK